MIWYKVTWIPLSENTLVVEKKLIRHCKANYTPIKKSRKRYKKRYFNHSLQRAWPLKLLPCTSALAHPAWSLGLQVPTTTFSLPTAQKLFLNQELGWIAQCYKVWQGFPGGSVVKNLSAVQQAWVQSLGWEDSLEKETATHSSILPWEFHGERNRIWLQSLGSQRVGHDWAQGKRIPTSILTTLSMQFLLSCISIIKYMNLFCVWC